MELLDGHPDAVAASVTSRTNPSYSSTPARPYCAHRCEGSRSPPGPTSTNSISWPTSASIPASDNRSCTRLSAPRVQYGSGEPS